MHERYFEDINSTRIKILKIILEEKEDTRGYAILLSDIDPKKDKNVRKE